MEGEVAQALRGIRHEVTFWIRELVLDAMVCTGMKMAGRASGLAVAADLHVPEERLTQNHERIAIAHISLESGHLRNGHRLQRSQILTERSGRADCEKQYERDRRENT